MFRCLNRASFPVCPSVQSRRTADVWLGPSPRRLASGSAQKHQRPGSPGSCSWRVGSLPLVKVTLYFHLFFMIMIPFVWTLLLYCTNFQFCHINSCRRRLLPSTATVLWTCFQIQPQSEKSSGNLMISLSGVSKISPGSSEPLTRPSLSYYRPRRTGLAGHAAIVGLEPEVKGAKEPRDRWWTALWPVVWSETGCWRMICSSSCRGSGLKIGSMAAAVRGASMRSSRVKRKGEARRTNEEPVWSTVLGSYLMNFTKKTATW